MFGRIWILALLLAMACGDDTSSSTPDAQGVSFSEDIAPIFASRCDICHHENSAIGYELSNAFDPESGIVNRENSWLGHGSEQSLVVDPGNPENSSLVVKVRDMNLDIEKDGNAMPYDLPYFSEEEIADVETWIREGALDSAFYAEKVEPLFGSEISLRRVSGRCTWCHYPGSSAGFDILDPFNPDTGMVGAASSSGGLIVSPNNPEESSLIKRLRGENGPRMPMHYPRLEESEVQQIVDWIQAGAPNN